MVVPAAHCPTAVQAVAVVQDTPDNWPCFAPAGRGACWMVQVVPFQVSASGSGPRPWIPKPTAVQADGAVHDTAASCVFVVPGLAAGRIF